MTIINIKDFSKLDLRVGTIVSAKLLEKAKTPAYLLEIDFGKLGVKHSSAQVTELYQPEELIKRQIIAIVNLLPKKIAEIKSDVLVLGVNNTDCAVVLLEPQTNIGAGAKIS